MRLVENLSFICLLGHSVSAAFDRTFAAAPKHASLKRSDASLKPNLEVKELVFHHEANHESLGANVYIEPKTALLIHEDVDHLISDVSCSINVMTVTFVDHDALKDAEATWSTLDSFTFVTQHKECSKTTEHGAWVVAFDRADPQSLAIHLSATETTLKKASQQLKVGLGEHLLSRIDCGQNRNNAPPVPRIGRRVPQSAPTPTFAFPSTATVVQTTSKSLAADISFSSIGKTIVPPENAMAAAVVPPNMNLKCLNCTMSGLVSLVAGGFTIPSGDDISITALTNFVEDGFLEFDTTNMAGNMSFELDLLPGFTASAAIGGLPRKSLGSISIAGIITFTPHMEFNFPISVTLQSPVTIQAGFTLDPFPAGKIILNVGEPSQSNATGFDTRVRALPFNINAPDLSFGLTVSARAMLSLDVGVTPKAESSSTTPTSGIRGGVGVFLDLPTFTVNVSSLTGVDNKCNPSSGKTDKYVQVNPGVSFDAGASYSLAVGSFKYSASTETALFASNITRSLEQQCLKWNDGSKSLSITSGNVTNGAPKMIRRLELFEIVMAFATILVLQSLY